MRRGIWEGSGQVTRVNRMIAWTPPSVGWVKLNMDGALHGNPGLATGGGVLRDGEGQWIQGFTLNIGVCSAPLAELWGGLLWALSSLGQTDCEVGVRCGFGDGGGVSQDGDK